MAKTIKLKPKTGDVVRYGKEDQNLKCDLSDEQLRQIGDDVARLVQERNTLENDKKAIVSDFKAKIDAADASIAANSNKIRNKYEYRRVLCKQEFNFTTCRVKVIRTDTNAIVEDRPMTYAEKDSITLFDGKDDDHSDPATE